MCSRRFTLSLSALTLLLIPVGSASAFDEADMWRIEAASRRAHAEHVRVLEQAARHRAQIMAQARAAREQTLRQARAAHARLKRQARAARARRVAASRAARRQLQAQRRAARRAAKREGPCRPSLALSFEERLRDSGAHEFSLEFELSGDDQVDADESLDPVSHDVIEAPREVYAPEPEPEVIHELIAEDAPEEEVHLESTSGPEGDFAQVEWAIIVRINDIRRARGLSELAYDARLQAAAMNHSTEMYRMNYFEHTSPVAGRETLKERIQLEGIGNFRIAGENLAMGPDIGDIAARFVEMWMDSPGHRDNILTEAYRFTGVGVYGLGKRVYATQLFSQAVTRSFN